MNAEKRFEQIVDFEINRLREAEQKFNRRLFLSFLIFAALSFASNTIYVFTAHQQQECSK